MIECKHLQMVKKPLVLLVCGCAVWFGAVILVKENRALSMTMCPTVNTPQSPSHPFSAGFHTLVTPLGVVSPNFSAPCFIHRTCKNPNALDELNPTEKENFVMSWMEKSPPTCNTILWHDQLGTELIQEFEPSLLPQYTWLHTGTERGDVVRLVALYHFGGVYADMDISLVKNFKDWTFGHNGVGMIVAMEYCKNNTRNHKTDFGVIQFAFAAVPGHHVVRRALEMFNENVRIERTTGDVYYKNYGYNAKIMRRTGPVVLSNAVKEELAAHGKTWVDVCDSRKPYKIPDSDVLILPLRSFNSPHNCITSYGVTRHYYQSKWASKSRNSWYVPQ